jgi:phosphoribosylglycinamide formyltransferase-1
MKRRVAILISGRGSNMAALIEAASEADFPADIVVVISNRADAPGLERASASGIPTVVIESKPFGKDRAAFEVVLQRALDEMNVELICLGGFMRLFTAGFVQRWYGKMLNIHPSLLPSFPGLDPHGQALHAGVKISGATVHFVIPETDAGPIVMQGAVPVRDDDTAETLAARVIQIEHRIYPEALRLLASGKIHLEGDLCRTSATAVSDDSLISPRAREAGAS